MPAMINSGHFFVKGGLAVQLNMVFVGEELTVYLRGELDHHVAAGIRQQIDQAIDRDAPVVLVLDFGQVSFMDSSGIGLVMGRYRLMKTLGGTVKLQNVPRHHFRVMQMAGLDKFLEVKVQ